VLVELTALARVDAVYVPPDIVSVAVLELVTPAEVDAVMLPVIVTEPVLRFETPAAAAAVTLPTITNVPAPLLNAPLFAAAKTFPFMVNVPVPADAFPAPAPVLPVAFPVSVTDPEDVCATPAAELKLPPTAAPVTDSAPVPLFKTAVELTTLPPVQVPTILAVAGDAAENVKQFIEAVVLLLVTFDVKVTPEFKTNVPVPAFESSVQVTFAVIVTVCPVEARASSAAPGTMPPTQVAPALKLPVAAERMSAIFYSPFA